MEPRKSAAEASQTARASRVSALEVGAEAAELVPEPEPKQPEAEPEPEPEPGPARGAALPTLEDDIVAQALAMGASQFGVPELWRAAHTGRGARRLALRAARGAIAALGWLHDALPTGLHGLGCLARLASARLLEGLVVAVAAPLLTGQCDESEATITLGNWYHKRGENYDLCSAEYEKLSAEEQTKYAKVATREDLGEDLGEYAAAGDGQEARLRRLLAAFGATAVASDAPNVDFTCCAADDMPSDALQKPLVPAAVLEHFVFSPYVTTQQAFRRGADLTEQ